MFLLGASTALYMGLKVCLWTCSYFVLSMYLGICLFTAHAAKYANYHKLAIHRAAL